MISYLRLGIWELERRRGFSDDPELIKDKFNDIFKHELLMEYNDVAHKMFSLYSLQNTITVFIDRETNRMIVADGYNTLKSIYNGIYETYDGKRLALNVNTKGLHQHYFEYKEKEDDEYVFVRSIIEGTANRNNSNIRRLISALCGRQFKYLESINIENYMFLDYSSKEKEQIIKDCEAFEKNITMSNSKSLGKMLKKINRRNHKYENHFRVN